MTLSSLGEFGFLERMRSWLGDAAPPALGALGYLDDAAVLDVPADHRLVATVDTLVDGRHFRFDWSSPDDVGWKAVAVNVSDVAAMGAEPRWLLVALGAPGDTTEDVLRGIYEGIAQACGAYGAALVGGDTVQADELVLTVTALGILDGDPLTRSGARVGDVLAVTGPLGLAAAGMNVLLTGDPSAFPPGAALECLDRHRRPRARTDAGPALRRAGVRTAMDLSDGLSSDVRRLAEASGVGVEIDAERVPVAPQVAAVSEARGWDGLALALAGGEDLELLVAVPPDRIDDVDVELVPVGRVVEQGSWLVRDGRTQPLPEGGWDHFAR